jgi:hypothetical protein
MVLDLSLPNHLGELIAAPHEAVSVSIETLAVHLGVLYLSTLDLPLSQTAEHDYLQTLVSSSVKLQSLWISEAHSKKNVIILSTAYYRCSGHRQLRAYRSKTLACLQMLPPPKILNRWSRCASTPPCTDSWRHVQLSWKVETRRPANCLIR